MADILNLQYWTWAMALQIAGVQMNHSIIVSPIADSAVYMYKECQHDAKTAVKCAW